MESLIQENETLHRNQLLHLAGSRERAEKDENKIKTFQEVVNELKTELGRSQNDLHRIKEDKFTYEEIIRELTHSNSQLSHSLESQTLLDQNYQLELSGLREERGQREEELSRVREELGVKEEQVRLLEVDREGVKNALVVREELHRSSLPPLPPPHLFPKVEKLTGRRSSHPSQELGEHE